MGNVHCCEKDSALDSHQVHDPQPLKVANRDLPAEGTNTADAPAEAAAATSADAVATEANAAPKKDLAKKAAEPTIHVPQPSGNEATNITLTLKIVSARGLRKANEWSGTSDPFVKCSIVGSTRANCATKVVPGELNPVWNCGAEMSGLAVNDVIQFEVFDKDAKSDDLLGRCELSVREVQNNVSAVLATKTGWTKELKLADTGKAGKASTNDSWLKLEISDIQQKEGSAGKAAKVLGVVSSGSKVMVTVVCARNLRNADFVGKSDPYCVCNISGKPDCKLQTPMIKDELNPKWNYTAQIANFEKGDCMNVTIYDEDLGGDDLLGRCTVMYDEFMPKGKKITKKLKDSGKIARDAEIDLVFAVTPGK